MTVFSQFADTGDGFVRNNGAGSWSSLRSASTGTVASQFNPMDLVYNDGTTADKYIDRGFLSFDLSSLPADAVIDSVNIRPYIVAESHGAGGSICLVAGTQASTSTLTTADFSACGSTELMSRVTISGLSTGAYATWALNASGIAHVQAAVGGRAKFCFRGSFDLDNSAPGTTVYSLVTASTSEHTGTAQDPLIDITYHRSFGFADAWAWSDSADVTSHTGSSTVARFKTTTNTWAWTDTVAPYRRSTTEVTVTAEGPNTALALDVVTTPSVDLSGAGTITVASTSGFASSGSAYVIDNTSSTQQQGVFTYTGKTSTTFTGCSFTSLIGSSVYNYNAIAGVSPAVGAPNAESHFPQITPMDLSATPVLMCSYQQHGGHSVIRGSLKFKKSSDGGQTWGSEQNICASPANGSAYGIFGHTIARMKNGRIIAIWYEHKMDYTAADSVAVFKTMLSYTDDQGATWSTPVKLDVNFGFSNDDGTNGFGSMLYTGSGSNATYGDLYVPVVGNADGIQVHSSGVPYRWFNKLYKITDGGASGTWSVVGTMATTAQTGGYANGEADLVIAENGTWVAHMRVEDGAYSRWQATSTDNGVTWTGHTQAIAQLANAAAISRIPGGTLVSTGGNVSATGYSSYGNATASLWSTDSGTTWQTARKIEAYNATYSEYNGADLRTVIDDPAVLVNSVFAYSQERGNQAGARTMFRWYVDPGKKSSDSWAWSDTAAKSAQTFARTNFVDHGLAGTYADTWLWSDGARDGHRTTTDTWAWTDTALAGSGATYNRTTTDAWAWSDTATQSSSAHLTFTRTATDAWAWSDALARTLANPRTTSDLWRWEEPSTASASPLFWLMARARRRTMSAPTKTYVQVQAKGTTRTATWTSPTYRADTEAGILVVLDVTAASGTGGLTLRINAHDQASSQAVPLNAAPTAVTTVGTTSYSLYPFSAVAGNVTQATSFYLPRMFSITVTHGDSSSYSYSLGYCLLP